MSSRLIKFLCINMFKLHEHGVKLKVGFRQLSQGMPVAKAPLQRPREKPAVKRRGLLGNGYPLLIIPVTAFGLGTWQVQRREWKLNLIKELEEKMSAPPVSLPDNLEEVNQMEYTRVKVRGTFDHSRELFIGPRTDVHMTGTGGLGGKSSPGLNVVTPFKLADRDETILVNRGFVSFKNRPPQMRLEGQVEGPVEIIGVIRLNDKKSILGSDPLKEGYWLNRNIDEMADIAQTAKVYIDADFSSTVPGGPLGGQTRVTLRNEHLSYIVTWYSLAAFTFFLWYKNFRSPTPHKTVLEFIKREHKRL